MSTIQTIKNLPILTAEANIDVVPLTLYNQASNDLAKVTVKIQLQQPLDQDTQFLIPTKDLKTQKVYLPDGSKAVIGDFDPTAMEDIQQLPTRITEAVNAFIGQPNMDTLRNAADLMTDFYEYQGASQVVSIPAGINYITFDYTKNIDYDPATGEHTLETIIPLPNFTLVNQGGSKASLICLMPLALNNDLNKVIEAVWTPPGGSPSSLEKTSIAGRVALIGYWQYDPNVKIRYRY